MMGTFDNNNQDKRLLVFNCHEAWVYQLGVLGYPLDIIVGLKGQYKQTWDEHIRPMPANSRLITLSEALRAQTNYYCIITHNITDLLDIKSRSEPRLIVLHSTLEGRVIEEKSSVEPCQMKNILHKYLELTGTHAVAVTALKARSWGFYEDVVETCCNPDDYPPYSGEVACGLRICNFIENRKNILLWDLYEKGFDGLEVKLVGHNPGMPGVYPSKDWQHLKESLSRHRFYIHTANPALEDGFNMASVEAMAAGMPILGNIHPSSPVEHGVSGFLSDDPLELRKYANLLLNDKDLAVKMGQKVRQAVAKHFSTARFKENFLNSIETARSKWLSKNSSLNIPGRINIENIEKISR